MSVPKYRRWSKMLKKLSFFIIITTLWFLILSIVSYGNENQTDKNGPSKTNLLINPFNLEKNRIVPGSIFQVKIDRNLFDEEQDKIIEIALEYEISKKGQNKLLPIRNYYFKYVDDNLMLFAEMPSWNKIKNIQTQSTWRGWLKPYKAHVRISYQKAENIILPFAYPVEIPYIFWAYIWGIIAVVVTFFIIGILKPEPLKRQEEFAEDKSKEEWEKGNKAKRFFLYPLNFAVTPLGTYSISLTQIIFWTFITIFGIVYVYWLSGFFIEITPQILMLLGIGGGTALAAKINAISRVYEVPPKYLNLVRKTRTPKLMDLISIGGQPNIFKFQMLAFTLLTGYIVIVEIIKSHAFPAIPNSLITMMGVSSLVYLGNEVTHKNTWDKIRKKKEAIEDIAKKNEEINISNTKELKKTGLAEVKELENLLREIYSGEKEVVESEEKET